MNFQSGSDNTTVECWVHDDKNQVDISDRQELIITDEHGKKFTVGSIFDSASEIKEKTTYVFFLFRVGIGRAYV